MQVRCGQLGRGGEGWKGMGRCRVWTDIDMGEVSNAGGEGWKGVVCGQGCPA